VSTYLRFELRIAPLPKSTRAADSSEKFVKDFAAAWVKVMNVDCFDLA
jgi:catalase (peroxidase I)